MSYTPTAGVGQSHRSSARGLLVTRVGGQHRRRAARPTAPTQEVGAEHEDGGTRPLRHPVEQR